MSTELEEWRSVLALYGVSLNDSGIVASTCGECSDTYYLTERELEDTLDEYGDVCLKYCRLCADEWDLV